MDIGNHTLIKALAPSRYGEVWQAMDNVRGHPVVLRQLVVPEADRRAAALAVAGAATGLSQPNVVACQPPITDERGIWLVEDFVAGLELTELLAPSVAMTVPQRLGLIRGSLLGLAYAHARGVVHGGVSPDVVRVDTAGTPQLTEWGAAPGQPDVAAVGDYASPELRATGALSPAADVYAAGRLLDAVLGGATGSDQSSADQLRADLRPVLDQATAADPTGRHPNAQALLDDLDRVARQRLGPVWWTTEGIGTLVASIGSATVGSATATVVAAGPGGGVVAGSLHPNGGGAVPGAGAPGAGSAVVAGGRLVGRGRLIALIAAGVVVVLLGAGAALAIGRGGPETAQPGPSSVAPQPSPSDITFPTTTVPTPTPTPTGKPKPLEGFSGTYTYVSVVTKSINSDEKVGRRYTTTWTVETSCTAKSCTSTIKPKKGESFVYAGSFNQSTRYKVTCINVRTGKDTKNRVPFAYRRSMKVTAQKGDLITKVAGTETYRQLKKCQRQSDPLQVVHYKITISYRGR